MLFYATWRIRYEIHPEVLKAINEKTPIILAHWHGDELALMHLIRTYKLATMISTSKDGTLMYSVVKKLGGTASRGSSTRGGVQALKGLVRLIRKDRRSACIAVDGPKGPIHQVKPGVFELSRLAESMVVPVGAAAKQAFVSEKSWNKAILPKPFTELVIVFGEPLPALGKNDLTKDVKLANKLRSMLFDARQHAGKLIARRHSEC